MLHKHHRVNHRHGLGSLVANLAVQVAAAVIRNKINKPRPPEPPSGGKTAKRT